MFTKSELRTIEIYEAEGVKKEVDDWPLYSDPFAEKTFMRLKPNGQVLDIGCGHGRVIPILPKLGINPRCYKGIDPSPAQIVLGKELYPEVDFEVGNIYQVGDAYPNYFDGFWCCMMLFHIPRCRLVEALCGLRKSLKLNAVGVIITPQGSELKVDDEGMEFMLYEQSELQSALHQAGFNSVFYNPDTIVQVGSIVAV